MASRRWFESLDVRQLWKRDTSTALEILRANTPARLDLTNEEPIAELPLRPGRTFPADMPRPDAEYGATGTPIFGGFITGEDYNPKLDGIKALAVYDEMRRSDAQVRATIAVLKLPLRAASWDIDPPDGSTDPQDQAIADFCAAALFDNDAMAQPWNFTLNHILLKIDFGVSLLEKVFTVGELGEIRYHRLAPRLPKTVFRWIIHPASGALDAVVQFAPKGGAFQYLTIPSKYLAVFCHEREGDQYFGRSVLRSAYMHWFFKTQAYRIDGVRLDRHGVGIPMAAFDENHRPTDKELTEVKKILRGLRTHERAYIVQPAGVTFSILIPKGDGGRGGAAGLIESVNHHNFMIGANILAGFLSTSQQARGALAHTSTLADMFQDSLQAIADDTAGDITAQLIRPLCDLNFDMTGRKYPTVRVSGIDSVDVPEMAKAISLMGPTQNNPRGFMTPDDATEDWFRDMIGAPPRVPPDQVAGGDGQPSAPDSTAVTRRPARTSPAESPTSSSRLAQPTPQDAGRMTAPGDTGGSVTLTPLARPPTGPQGELATATMADVEARRKRFVVAPPPPGGASGAHPLSQDTAIGNNDGYPLGLRGDPVVINGRQFSRAPTDREEAVFNLREIPDQLDYARDRLVARLKALRQEQARTVIRDVVTRDADPATGQFTDLRPATTSMPLANEVYLAIRQTQDRVAKYGAQQVRAELQKQGAPVTMHGGRTDLAKASDSGRTQQSALVSSARVTAQQLNDQWKARILDSAIRIRRSGLQAVELERAITDDVEGGATTGLARAAGQEVNEAFALGRATEAGRLADLVDVVQYSAILDQATCPVCEELDKEEFDPASDEWAAVEPPNPQCEGRDNCRCVGIWVAKGDVAADDIAARKDGPA